MSSSQPLEVLVLVEHVDRELDLLCLVKALLARDHHITLTIANFYVDAPELLSGPAPKTVLIPFCYGADDLTMRDYVAAWPDTRFINMAWEQILYPSNQTLKAPRDAFAKQQVMHLAWSQIFVDFLVKQGVNPNHITLIGHWLYDMYAPKYRNYFATREELATRYKLDSSKRWVFVPENYRWAFFSESKLRKMAAKGVNSEELLDMRSYCRENLALLAEWCNALAADDAVEVIFRPRPATSTEELRQFLAQEASLSSPAFHVIKDYSAREWVLASDIVVSSFSTVLIEAAVADKEILMVEPTPIPKALRYSWCDLAPIVKTQEDFLARSKAAHPENKGAALLNWAQAQFFAYPHPIERLVETIAKLAGEAQHEVVRNMAKTMRLPKGFAWLSAQLPPRLKHRLFQTCIKGYSYNADTHEKDFFTAKDVRARTGRWRGYI